MSVFDDLPDLIADLIVDEGLGASVTYTSITAGAYNTANGQTAAATATTEIVSAVIEDFRGLELLNGFVQAGDKKISIAAASLTAIPKPSDTITVGGTVYTVQEVSTTEAGGVPILFVLKCRRA